MNITKTFDEFLANNEASRSLYVFSYRNAGHFYANSDDDDYFFNVAERTSVDAFEALARCTEMLVVDRNGGDYLISKMPFGEGDREASDFAKYFPGFVLLGVDVHYDTYYMVRLDDEDGTVYEWVDRYDEKMVGIDGDRMYKVCDDIATFTAMLTPVKTNYEAEKILYGDDDDGFYE